MTVKLFGYDDGTIDNVTGGDYFCLYKYTAVASGTCSEIKVKVAASISIKAAVYADNSGEPGARLAKQDTPAACVTGWNTIALEANCSIVSGTDYWLAFISSAAQVGYDSAAGVMRYKAATYSTFTFPDPAGTGFTTLTSTNGFIAGWGVECTVKTSGDNGGGVELTVIRGLGAGETGSALESALMNAAVTAGESGAGNEIGGLLKSFFGSEQGGGADAVKILNRKAGSDLKLQSHQGHVGIPHKEVSL